VTRRHFTGGGDCTLKSLCQHVSGRRVTGHLGAQKASEKAKVQRFLLDYRESDPGEFPAQVLQIESRVAGVGPAKDSPLESDMLPAGLLQQEHSSVPQDPRNLCQPLPPVGAVVEDSQYEGRVT